MGFLYNIIFYASYFFILIIFSIIAIIFAKKLHSWLWYSIGALITLFSLLGNQKSYESYYGSYYAEEMMAPYWTIYFLLLVIVAVVILIKYSNAKNKKNATSEKASIEKEVCEENVQLLFTCEMCEQSYDQVTYAKIKDDMGIRYRNLCDSCMEKYNATPETKK